ncbi:MAG: hypothetical protein JW863_21235 [Chitinispirillaceae bacterium]|nr:hypothetical protein [Chitinispirillaceae bacterium]
MTFGKLQYKNALFHFQHSDDLSVVGMPRVCSPSGVIVRASFKNGVDTCGTITLEPDKASLDKIDNASLGTYFTKNGNLEEVQMVQSPLKDTPVEGTLFEYSFTFNSTPYCLKIIRYKLPYGNNGRDWGCTVAFWGETARKKEIDTWMEEGTPDALHRAQSWTNARLFVSGVTTMMILEALLSLMTGTPVWGRNEANLGFSVIALILFSVFFAGFLNKKIWGVYSLGLMYIANAVSSIMILLMVPSLSSSNVRYYIPSLEAGGIMAFLWIAGVPLTIIAVVLMFVKASEMVESE